jgi:hypothetical protein
MMICVYCTVEQTDTIAIVKKKLEDKEGTYSCRRHAASRCDRRRHLILLFVAAGPVEAQRLIFGGKILEDAKTVAEYELTKGENPAPLFLVINRMSGTRSNASE